MYDSPTYESEKKNELSFEDCIKVLDDFCETNKKLGSKPAINFSGGDPLIRNDFFKILEECKKRKIPVQIIGNPYLINDEMAKKLKKLKIVSFQISIDGLEKTHDEERQVGSFKESLRALAVLKKHGIQTGCMFTVSKKNAKELIPLIKILNNKVDDFDFARMVPIGSAAKMKEYLFTANEYNKFLLKVFDTYRKISKKSKTSYGTKENLWTLLFYEKGTFKPKKGEKLVREGCGMGIRHMTILSDGTVVPCRRMPIKVGKVPQESFYDIFLKSKELQSVREIDKLEKCRKCELLNYCRGCPAVAYAMRGNSFAPDPQCWKK
jgi:radical SAM protein with 4Fe4S-binding SPASM domain